LGQFDSDKKPTKPKRNKTIPQDIRQRVWNKYFPGTTIGKCYVCHDHILNRDFQVGHNKARAKGGKDNIPNLRPICASCNRGMGTTSIEVYKAKYFGNPKKKEVKKSGLGENANSDDIVAKLEIMVVKHLATLSYEIMSKKHGFDMCARKTAFFDSDKYLAIGFYQNKAVTSRYVKSFIDKLMTFEKTMRENVLITPKVQGLIAYTGELPEDIPELVKNYKPAIEFKKF
jgi:5-methylcytosine-specific restriction endonuclease McrA